MNNNNNNLQYKTDYTQIIFSFELKDYTFAELLTIFCADC